MPCLWIHECQSDSLHLDKTPSSSHETKHLWIVKYMRIKVIGNKKTKKKEEKSFAIFHAAAAIEVAIYFPPMCEAERENHWQSNFQSIHVSQLWY